MHQQRAQLLEELRKAEQARDLLRDLEPLLAHQTEEKGPQIERHVRQLEQLAQTLPEAHIVRLEIESALGPSELGNGSRARSAIEGEISTLQGALRYKAR